jgi:nicotinamidase-related amidase
VKTLSLTALLASVVVTACGGSAAPAPSSAAPASPSLAVSKPAAASAAASVAPSVAAASKPAAATSAQAGSVAAKPAGSAAGTAAAKPQLVSIQMPASPNPVSVSLKPKSTALVVMDVAETPCKPQPNCTQKVVPNIASLLQKARAAGVFVVYSVPEAKPAILPEVAPAAGDPLVPGVALAQDRFYNTAMDSTLKAKGIDTVILTGWRINGSLLYTSVGATLRGYTVVVPADCTSATTDYDVAIGNYQLLTQLSANADNQPLKPKATTISRSDLITFQ